MTFIGSKTMKVKKILLVSILFLLILVFYLYSPSSEGFQASAATVTIQVLVDGTTADTSSAQYTVAALPADTVASVKAKLQPLTTLTPTQQTLNLFDGKKQTLLTDANTLSSYGIVDKATPVFILTTCQFVPLSDKYQDYYNSAYDKFKDDEVTASTKIADARRKTEPIYSAPDLFIPNFGGLTEIDPGNIPWDADNKYANPNSIMWGTYSPNTSTSIFSKVYSKNVNPVYNADTGKCEYKSPVFATTTYGTGEMIGVMIAEQFANMAGALAVGFALDKAFSQGAEGADVKAKPPQKAASISVSEARAQPTAGNMKSKLKAPKGNTVLRKALAKVASIMGPKVLSRLAVTTALSSAAATASTASVVAAWAAPIFIFIGIACILLAALTPAILDSMTEDIRLCPPGYKRMNEIIPDYASNIISWIPLIGDIISTFQPYACVWDDPEKKGKVPPTGTPAIIIAEPIPDPPYYDDITLSAYYHNRCPATDTGRYDDPLPNCPPVPGQPYYPPMSSDDIAEPWVDFSDRSVTDQMAQYYYDQSIRSPNTNGDGTITYEYITKIYSVAASSQFSCDILCAISTATYDPLTGCSYKVEPALTDDAGGNMHDRRFYFYVDSTTLTVKQKNSAGKVIGKGKFIISGCTNQDGTAPDAYDGMALPKIYTVDIIAQPKTPSINTAFLVNAGIGVAMNASVGVGLAGAGASAAHIDFSVATPRPNQKNDDIYAIDTTTKGYKTDVSGNRLRYIRGDYYTISIGPDISDKVGTGVNINKCTKVGVTTSQCASIPYLQNMVNTYHLQNPTKHLKTLSLIEARATNEPSNKDFIGNPRVASVCYYEGTVADYDKITNLEKTPVPIKLALNHKLDTTKYPQACVFVPTAFDANPMQYIPMKFQILNPGTSTTKLPTKDDYVDLPIPKIPMSGSMAIPRPIPDGAPISKGQLDILVAGFNANHTNMKIIRTLRTWAPTINPARADLEVEMLRTYSGETKSVIEKETVAIYMNVTNAPPFPYSSDGSSTVNSGTFIQPNTPDSIGDLSGGVMTYKTFMQGVATSINSLLAQFNITNISDTVLKSSQAAKLTSDDILEKVYVSQTLAAPCAASSCSDPQILNAIIDKYNADNAAPANKIFGVTTQKMVSVLKAGVSSPTSCDILFNNQIDTYDSVVQDPVKTVNIARAMRFTLVDTTPSTCKFSVKSYIDVSSSAIGIRSDKTELPNPYKQSTCQVDCRTPSLLVAIKAAIEGQNTAKAASALKQVITSYSPSENTCEYEIKKDYTTYGTTTKTVTGTTSYVSASVKFNSTCVPTLDTVGEIYPEILDIQTDTTTGLQVAYMNGKPITMPVLFSYDKKNVSSRVNTTVSSF